MLEERSGDIFEPPLSILLFLCTFCNYLSTHSVYYVLGAGVIACEVWLFPFPVKPMVFPAFGMVEIP